MDVCVPIGNISKMPSSSGPLNVWLIGVVSPSSSGTTRWQTPRQFWETSQRRPVAQGIIDHRIIWPLTIRCASVQKHYICCPRSTRMLYSSYLFCFCNPVSPRRQDYLAMHREVTRARRLLMLDLSRFCFCCLALFMKRVPPMFPVQ